MTDGVIFDVDGTIWDTTPVVAKAWNASLSACGLSERVSADRLKGLFGLPMDDIILDILPDKPFSKREEFKKKCYESEHIYLEREPGTVYPHMKETFCRLSERVPVFIVSNCQSGYIELMLEKTGLGPYVTDFACYGDKGLLKAENIKLIAKKHGLRAPIYVGDTKMDAEACREAGVPIVWARYGFGIIENPEYAVDDVSGIMDMIFE